MNKDLAEYEKDLNELKEQIFKESNTLLTKRDLLERFCKIDKEYNGRPWNLLQILSNINILIGQEQSQPKTEHWVPVSEGMPNEYADVICCTDAKEVFIATYLGKMNDGTDCFDDANGMMCEGDVIAWMPLPEPYEPQESEVQDADSD